MNVNEDALSSQVWLARAQSNLALAGQDVAGVYLEDLCFEAQQAAEKALKALCVHFDLDFPKTHSLAKLMDILEGSGVSLPEEIQQAAVLTQYAVRTRYPGVVEPITRSEYSTALDLAEKVVEWAEKIVRENA